MLTLKNIRVWWKQSGKIWTFRILIVFLTLAAGLRSFQPFRQYIPDERFLLLFIGPLLLLMLNILMDVGNPDRGKQFDLVTSESAINELKSKIKNARLLDIASSSTESFYLQFRDELLKSSMQCRLILRNPLQSDLQQRQKVLGYAEAWKAIQAENPNFKVEIKYSDNSTFRFFMFDHDDAYFGFYKWDGRKYWGHNVSMVHTGAGTELGNYLLDIAINRFQNLWDSSSDTISFRLK